MSGKTVQFERPPDQAADGKRQQSTILFPYLDLEAAVEVADAMYKTRGHGAIEAHELAATMNQTLSGAFRLKTGTARIFGLSEKAGRDATKLSELGIRIIEAQTEKEARAEAFLAVPLYRAIYDKYKGQRLPPPKALEREMESLGVSGKQTDKARQAFERSARQAGYFEKGEDRLVKPFFGNGSERPLEQPPEDRHDPPGAAGGDGGSGGKHHPLIEGLLITLPAVGSEWPQAKRKAWLTMANSIFGMIYKDSLPPATEKGGEFDELLG